MAQHLTDVIVKRLPLPARHDITTKDTLVRGFGIRVTAAGARSFTLNYRRKADGRQRRLTIGSFPDWGTTAAREEAKRLKRAIDGGGDPVGEQEDIRTAPTITDLCRRFEVDYLPRKRPRTQHVYSQQIRKDILPAFGTVKVAAVSHTDVEAFHHRLSARAPTVANRTLAVLSKMFSLAVRWRMRPDNPCKGVERNQEHKCQRYLTVEEMARLATALAELRDQGAANAVRLLLLTGARRGELLAARWADFDLKAGIWIKPGTTAKQRTQHRVPLSAPACQLLHEMRVPAFSEFLFPARSGGHRPHIDKAWIALRTAAGVPDLRLHDLRHSFASMLASSGFSLPLIGALLGHSTPVTTARYAHLFDDVQRTAVERVGAIVERKDSGEVVPLPQKRR